MAIRSRRNVKRGGRRMSRRMMRGGTGCGDFTSEADCVAYPAGQGGQCKWGFSVVKQKDTCTPIGGRRSMRGGADTGVCSREPDDYLLTDTDAAFYKNSCGAPYNSYINGKPKDQQTPQNSTSCGWIKDRCSDLYPPASGGRRRSQRNRSQRRQQRRSSGNRNRRQQRRSQRRSRSQRRH